MNKIVELYNNAIDKKELNNLKDDVLKLIGNSCICNVERKGSKKDDTEKIVMLKEKSVRKIIAKILIKIKIKTKII